MSAPSGRELGWPVAATLLAVVYAAGAGAVLFTPDQNPVAVWWPSAGISVSILVLAAPRRRLVLVGGIAAVVALANLTGGRSPGVAALFGLADAAEALLAVSILTHARPWALLRSQEDLVRLILATLAGAGVVALGVGFLVSERSTRAAEAPWLSGA